MEEAVGAQAPTRRRPAATPSRSVNRPPASSTMTCTAARSQRLTTGSHGDVERPLGDEHVHPEVAEAAAAPGPPAAARRAASPAPVLEPRADAGVGEVGLGQRRRRRHRGWAAPSAKAPAAAGRPPAPPERRRRGHADDQLAVVLERDERGPDRDALDVVRRAVDRVDDPPGRGVGRPEQALLLAEHGVVGPGARPAGARIAASGSRSASVTSRARRPCARRRGRAARKRGRVTASAAVGQLQGQGQLAPRGRRRVAALATAGSLSGAASARAAGRRTVAAMPSASRPSSARMRSGLPWGMNCVGTPSTSTRRRGSAGAASVTLVGDRRCRRRRRGRRPRR